ncbi:hypothetical protein QTP88_025339 [Uroleucon formosanum]
MLHLHGNSASLGYRSSKTLVEDVCEPDVMAENGNYGGGKTHFCQLNSLWSVWYGLLATVLNVYSVLLATRRLSGKTLYIYAVFRYSDVPSMSEILTIWSVLWLFSRHLCYRDRLFRPNRVLVLGGGVDRSVLMNTRIDRVKSCWRRVVGISTQVGYNVWSGFISRDAVAICTTERRELIRFQHVVGSLCVTLNNDVLTRSQRHACHFSNNIPKILSSCSCDTGSCHLICSQVVP